jgi:hypothetical protein
VELYIKLGIATRGARGIVHVDASKLGNLAFIDEMAVCSAGEPLENQNLYFVRRGDLNASNRFVGVGKKKREQAYNTHDWLQRIWSPYVAPSSSTARSNMADHIAIAMLAYANVCAPDKVSL